MEKQIEVRNFSIIAHIDHGKSTLADRMLELTHTIADNKLTEQFLDQLDIERERGITIKLQPVRMAWTFESQQYILNLIDTPGHVDFSYEVSRSLAAVEGALLLVDATQGIQAQTLANAYLAVEQGLTIIPVINKIDLPAADVPSVVQSLADTFGFKAEEIYQVSGKTGQNVPQLLNAIVTTIPAPNGQSAAPLRAMVFDSHYDKFKGVICHIRIVDGKMSSNQQLRFMASNVAFQATEVGYFRPDFHPQSQLVAGDIGYVATGLKDVSHARVGDTITKADQPAERPLPGYRQVTPMVFAGIYPTEPDHFPKTRDALEKLKLNDAALIFEPEHSEALGSGFRCGFLGLLHMDVVRERLEREYDLSLIITAPSVRYEVIRTNGQVDDVASPAKLPDQSLIAAIKEPIVKARLVTMGDTLGKLIELVNQRRGVIENMEYVKGAQAAERIVITAKLPLSEIITDFYDRLKSLSSGYATFDYDYLGNESVDAVKLEILVNGQVVDAFAKIVPKESAERAGRELVERLRDVMPRQQYEIAIQAALGGSEGNPGRIVARADVKAYRKDVISGLYGGDRTRKDKLLDKQKEGKKRMKQVGNIAIPQEAFLAVLKQ